MTRVPECRTREHFPGCRASAPHVPELKPRPYPVDFPTTLRVLSERDTCPRVPPADKTLRKPPELATRSECLNSKLPREPSESPRVPRLTRENPEYLPRAPNAPRGQHVIVSPGCLRLRRVSRAADLPDAAGQPANHPRKTLPDARRVRRVSIIPGATLLFIIGNSRKWL